MRQTGVNYDEARLSIGGSEGSDASIGKFISFSLCRYVSFLTPCLTTTRRTRDEEFKQSLTLDSRTFTARFVLSFLEKLIFIQLAPGN